MKESRYNFFFEKGDGNYLAYNAFTNAFAEVSAEEYEIITEMLEDPGNYKCDSKDKESVKEELTYGGYLIDDDFDELDALRLEYYSDRFNDNTLNLTIAPTMRCNFRCEYCYEEHLKIDMSKEIQDAIVKLLENSAERLNEFTVTWFGGEPTLKMDIIEDMTARFKKICKKNNISYSATIVSNGYILNKKMAQKLKDLDVIIAQITLDGPKEIHDVRRPVVGGAGSFDKIIDNLKEISDILRIHLRINVDKNNYKETEELFDYLEEVGLKNKVLPYFGIVTAYTDTCSNIAESCFDLQEYSDIEITMYEKAVAKGYNKAKYRQRISGGYCTADRVSSMAIAPNGLVFNCWNHMSSERDDAVGSLAGEKYDKFLYNYQKWMGHNVFEKEKCRECKVLPICMGGCPYENMKLTGDATICNPMKFNITKILQIYYDASKKIQGKNHGRAREFEQKRQEQNKK